MIKAVIFDCFGVLTTDNWKEFVASLPADQVDPARALMYAHDSARLTEAELIEEVKKMTGRTPRDAQRLINDEKIKNLDLLYYIKELKESYKIGLLSNIGSNWIRDTFLSEEEQGLFDDMIFSYETHLAKPDPEIFELMAKRLGAEPAECVLVDDSAGHCAAAARLGVKTVIYENFEQMKRQLETTLADSKS